MAGASEPLDSVSSLKLEETLNCPICLEVYTTPKALACLHTFCETCLHAHITKLSETGEFNGKIYCPLCRVASPPPDRNKPPSDWARLLPMNYAILPIIETVQSKERVSKKIFCDSCSNHDNPNPAVNFCTDCQKNICGNCLECHKKSEMLKLHTITELGDITKFIVEKSGKHAVSVDFCDEHPDEAIKYFCEGHSMLLCSTCVIDSHRPCNTVTGLKEMGRNLRKGNEIEKLQTELKAVQPVFEGITKALEDNVIQIEEEADALPNRVKELQDKAMKVFDDLYQRVLTQCNNLKKTCILNVSNEAFNCKSLVAAVESSLITLANVKENGSDIQLFITFHKLKQQMKKYQENLDKMVTDTECTKLELKIDTALEQAVSMPSHRANVTAHQFTPDVIAAMNTAEAPNHDHMSYTTIPALSKKVLEKGILDDLTNKLEAIDVSTQCDSKDTVQLTTNTTIQLEKSKQIIETFAEHKLMLPRQTTGRGFVDIDTVDCSSIAWDACRIVKYDLVQQLEKGPTGLSYDNGKLLFDRVTPGCSDKDQKLISQLKDFLSKDFDEIPVEDTGKDVYRWCRDIAAFVGGDCCVYIPDRHTVIAYADKYGTIHIIRHQLNMKQVKVKQTGRGRQTQALVASDDQMRELASPESPPIFGAEQQAKMMVPHTRGSTTGFDCRRDADNVKTYPTSEGVLVKVYIANILRLHVDCIVNSTNGSLQHGGGVARVIAEAAGYNLTRDCHDYVRKTGDVPVGMAYTSTAGDLSYDCVIHTVGPCWTDYQPHSLKKVQECEDDLFNAILNSFYEAEKRGLKSIALPAISSAIFRVPQEICAYQYAKATLHYSKGSVHSNNALQEIHFIDKNEDIVLKIQRSFKDMFQDSKLDPPYDIHDFVNRRSHSPNKRPPSDYTNEQSSQESGMSRAKYGGKGQTGPTSYEDKSTGGYTFHMMGNERQTLKLYTADIVRVNVPAIVCSDDARGSGQGFIARELAERGEMTPYASDKKEQFAKYNSSKGKKVDGDVVLSDGFSNFKRIFHAIMPSYLTTLDAATVTPTLKKAYSNVLQKCADNKKLDTIAMPLLATGRASTHKLETSAKAFLDSYLDFCNKMKDKQQTLTVHLVCHEFSKMQVVNRVLYAHVRDKQTKSGSPPQRLPPPASAVPPKTSTHWPSAQFTAYPSASKVDASWSSRYLSTGYPYTPTYPPAADYNPLSWPTTRDTTGDAKSSKVPDNSQKGDSSDNEDCVICMDPMTKSLKCGHKFCTDCIDEYFKYEKICPMCGAVCGIITGDQPPGTMVVYLAQHQHCAGYETVRQLQITYNFPDGTQGDNHPSPGKRYRGITRTGLLPDNRKGRLICEMLQVAFERKLVFTIGDSRTTGQQGVITCNDIRHKTDPTAGTPFGYPDVDYLDRVIEELAANGVTQADVPNAFQL